MIENIMWIALCIYFESRDQYKVKGARDVVAHSILNRSVKRKLSPKEVVRQRKQYSWYNSRVIPPIEEGGVLIDCVQVAVKCYIKHGLGLRMAGVDHYYDDSMAANPPYWAASMKPLGKIGAFYTFKS